MILAVTSYVPIPGHPRSEEQYRALGNQLFKIGIPIIGMDGSLEQCWLYQYLHQHYMNQKFTYSIDDNPVKNSLGYHCVQAQKSELLALAAENTNADVVVWIDYGIFSVPGVTGQIVRDFMERAEGERLITIPGCWGRDYEYRAERPCWRFCGGLIVMPREHALMFDLAMKGEYKRALREDNNVSWEVNMMAQVEQHHPELPLWHYRADHNQSMFTNYQTTEFADGPGVEARL